ncbi:hypothetical protein [Halorubrum saccharovorum]|jgi:hypothetical protein|uniref:hypothetical protein n=1 Tax=Halorubrum saccharovorum TaxID=2248 RepID=UPI0009B5ABDE|nr:hypothetical protein [Halorubrum saccharovorum]
MNAHPSYTVKRETAATLRDWLFENAVETHGDADISKPLAELAAAIDGVLEEGAAAVALGAWAQTESQEHSAPTQAHSPTPPARDTPTAASTPWRRPPQHRPAVRYRTPFACSVCGNCREVELSLRVCAFVDECPRCGTVARFTVSGIPRPVRDR